jgi:outer membrane protein assembly factor BamB
MVPSPREKPCLIPSIVISSPAVWNGVVYFGGGDGNVYALETATGTLKWKFHAGDVVHRLPSDRRRDLIYRELGCYFYALDAATGKEKWRFKTGEDHDIYNQVGIQSSAAVADGTVYFGCRDSNLYALDAATGQKKWAFNNKGSWVIASPAVQDGKIYFATSDSAMLYAMDAKSGTPIFSLNYKHWPMFSSPAIAGGMLYIGSNQGRLFSNRPRQPKAGMDFRDRRFPTEWPSPDHAGRKSKLSGRLRR